ncbi:DUF4252 domain-containing protein [Maribacter algarum]|uniref:DUF4252 domain-containing protein n=2 Tax=Maribacter algarum (ex Zhang et al. 2020) TaxID=2578118 RepID=A0A5S3PI42_9FLAO|nr:DUF4252 domain-containing protein [Maribacter algarum]
MKNIVRLLVLTLVVTMASCSSTQSLQEYYVDNSENPNFLSFDVPVSLLNLEEVELSTKEKEAISSLKKLDVLAFKKTTENTSEYSAQKTSVKTILKNPDFTELMKMNTPYGKATVKYLGDEDAIDEVIIYGDNKEKGFALIRVLGKDMNPANMMQLLQAIQKSDYKGEGFEKLEGLLKG